jgi:molybdopterin adenylyltransferase
MKHPETFKVLVITLSDRASAGDYNDLSGPRLKQRVESFFPENGWKCNVDLVLIPDNKEKLYTLLEQGGKEFNLIITTGGTGIGPNDITIEVVKPLLSKEIPGIMEFIRIKYGTEKPNALLSRGVAGIIGNALVFTLPGSVRAVNEYMDEIEKVLVHLILMQYGIESHGKVSG